MQIFKTNIVKLAYIIALPLLRTASVLAMIKACVLPLEQLRGDLVNKRADVNYWMQITPQKCYLEKALNDTFDHDQRRIFLTNSAGIDIQLIHSDAAEMPVIIGQDSSEQYMLIHNDAGYTGGGINFIVNLNGVSLSEYQLIQLRTIVDRFKLADKTFEIYS